MNKMTPKTRRRLCRWLVAVHVLIPFLLPLKASAASYVDEAYNYQLTLNGSNTIRLKVPVYNEKSDDHWVCNGNIYVQVANDKGEFGSKQALFYWREDESSKGHDNDESDLWCRFRTAVGGSFDVTQGNSSNHFTLTSGDGEQRRLVYENADGRTYDIIAVWRLPYDLLGKTLKFSWDVKCDYTNGLAWSTEYSVSGLSDVTITMPDAESVVSPQVTMATIAYSESGKLEIPWFIASNKLTAARYEYIDHQGNTVRQELPTNSNSGTIYLDATVPHKSFRVVVSYKDDNNYEIANVASESQDLKMVHAPEGLIATPLADRKASVQLQWHIVHPSTEDISDTDFFEVQRSLTGDEADFVTISAVPFLLDAENQTYEFVDSTLVDAVAEGQLKEGTTLDGLTYRVRRMITQNWGWDNNTCAASNKCIVSDLHLLPIKDYSAAWEDEDAFTVRVSWDYADDYGAVWDDRAEMRLSVVSTNGEGAVVDSTNYMLTKQERADRYKILNLSRTCVNFHIKVYVSRGTSPFHLWDEVEPYFFPIRSAADWNTFRQKVIDAAGKKNVYARLYADITTGSSCGDLAYPFKGTFDGNGHTLRLEISHSDQYQSAFRIVGNASIYNLHTDGFINAGGKFAAGLVGGVAANSTVFIGNCRSSVSISSSINGDATNGGFVGVVRGGSNVTFNNCQFDGSFKGDNCHSNGGFVGYFAPNNTGTFNNCLFSPDHLDTKRNQCATWARTADDEQKTLTFRNSTATKEYNDHSIVIANGADWLSFAQMVEEAKGAYDIDAIMTDDILVSSEVGYTASYPFRGTFDGNGHTLNVSINNAGSSNTAPFSHVKDCTIKNLHVTGTVKGGLHSAGLIGCIDGNPSVRIEKVWVSTDVTTTSDHLGGIVGHTNDVTMNMTDCCFDGTLTANGSDGSYAGSIFGWGGNGSWTLHRVYDNGNFENCYWKFFALFYSGGAWYAWGSNSKSTLTVTSHSWNDVNYYYKTDQNEVVNLMNAETPGSWALVNGKAAPVMGTEGLEGFTAEALIESLGNGWKDENGKVVLAQNSTGQPVTNYPTPTLPTFYHEGTGTIDSTLVTTPRQSSVLLTWKTDGKPIDFFIVLRREKGQDNNAWNVISPKLDKNSYEDTSVSPLKDYEYKVRAISDCEGQHTSETKVVAGACKHTGRLEGYVRFNDGTGVPGIQLEIVSDETRTTVETDESGYYEAEDLSYKGRQSITYVVTPVATAGIQLERTQYSVTFNSQSNNEMVSEFTITNGLLFNAYVMYDGTSIPVKGAHFKVNGKEVHRSTTTAAQGASNNKGNFVETDFEGNAQFMVLGNTTTTIQVVMDGHTFTGDGYYKSADGVYLTEKVGKAYFYDATLVKLTGRVVGGDVQGNLPLDNNLSKNNLGNDLTMVLTLEGDNTSWLVFDNQDPMQSRRSLTFKHPGGNGHKTTAEVERKRMTVKPDSVTGEYVLMLPPVRWKVTQVYCEGYPTLFQDGMVNEIIDLTECLTTKDSTYVGTFTDVDGGSVYQPVESYNYRYSRVYHAPVEITYKQIGYDTFDYFGDQAYFAQTIGGIASKVPLAYSVKKPNWPANRSDSLETRYTFGHPVFSLERKYPIQITVAERYPWNGVKDGYVEDIVPVSGGRVTVHNGLKNGLEATEVTLDSVGCGVFYLQAEATTRLLGGDDALRTVTMTLEQDGTTYEAEPLKGYILNMFATGGAKDVIVNGWPQLIDILRDPPGGGSSATLSKGSKLKYTYTLDMSMKAGFNLEWTQGTTLENFQGVVAAPEGAGSANGIINSSNVEKVLDFEYAFTMEGKRAFSYTMNVNQDITTSTASTMVGADADVYIGMVQNVVVSPMSTIRAIPDSIYQQMLGRLGGTTAGVKNSYGSLVHIAEGSDAQGTVYHLVRDESLAYGPQVKSQFIHTQKHILTQILPEKVEELRAMMFTGTADEAQAKANATGKPVYRSLVDADDDNFAVVNTKDDEVFYYTSTMPEETGMNYVIHLPAGTTNNPIDEVAEKCQIIFEWLQMVANNEHEKLRAYDFVANYDVDGGSKITYSEQFENDYTISNYYHLPGVISGSYFDTEGLDAGLGAASIVGMKVVTKLLNMLWSKLDSKTKAGSAQGNDNKNPAFESKMSFYGKTFKFRILPVLNYAVKDVSGESHTFSRKESFTLSMDKKSHLNIDVFRAQTDTAYVKSDGLFDVFSSQNYYDGVDYVKNHISRDNTMSDVRYARGFVYRTRGGATCNPWEDARYTSIYEGGTLLDERTKKISNPKITLDRQSISGVPVGDPARFKVYMTNDSEQPEAVTGSLRVFNLHLNEKNNPNGAKVYIDGTPLNSHGIDVVLDPGVVVQKTIEVHAGDGFDFEGLQLGLWSPDDRSNSYDNVAFDVHFLRQAGPVNISTPGDQWVMNTNAQWNEKRGWFLPVTIDGFNKYQHNFDHIEFQYKESLRGDDAWTNLCSFYADSTLMAQASGVREMIPENGNIVTQFYGEGIVTEKAYALRAVLYCRNGNTFLTTASKILSGVKDTRRPQLFGTPEPVGGILGIGDKVVFNFSEDIEHNYLSPITNFEVKGEMNNQNVTETVSLQFDGNSSVESEAQRNFSDKDLTIDLMVKPDFTGQEMPLFSHGTNGKKLQLWLTADYHLKAVVDDQTFVSTDTIEKNGFTQVALTLKAPTNTSKEEEAKDSLTFYNGGVQIGQFKLAEPYKGTGTLIFGRTNETDRTGSKFYKGRMMEARVWYRALNGGQVGTTYGSKRLTGYEVGLVDYYPMNEGTGDYALDKTQGANAKLYNAAWAIPYGLSLHMDWDDKGIELRQNALNCSKEQDYTLMFWFKTDSEGRGVLLSNGAGRRDELNAENQFNIGFEAEKLMYRSNGQAFDLGSSYSDNKWHHYAMTVSRSYNLVNIYVDQTLKATFSSDSLGGISGGHPMIGGAKYDTTDSKGQVATIDTRNWLRGNIDELMFFGQALPLTLIKAYATKSPSGDEAGLLSYLAFDRQERQKDNDLMLTPYPYSKKVYLDSNGNVRYELDPVTQEPTTTPMRDYLFVGSPDEILAHIDADEAAPVIPYEELKNLSFNFVGKDNQVLVNINEHSSRINRRNIYVTLRDIEDKNGNAMASPATACYFVNNSVLRWLFNHENETIHYGESTEMYLSIYNDGATSHTYTIENCPKWLTLDKYSNIIEAQESETIKATVNKNLNVGSYDEILYLTDEDGVSEPFYLNLTVEGDTPDWAWNVDSDLLQYSMNIVGRVYLHDEIDIDARDIVGAFGQDGQCHGFAHIGYSTQTGESNLFLTLYDNKKSGRDLSFKLWQYSTGRELQLSVGDKNQSTLKFQNAEVLGIDNPVRFSGGNKYVQTFDLKKGWNWVSFNVTSEALFDLGNLLDGLPWKENDALTDLNSDATLLYHDGHWLSSGSVTTIDLTPQGAYAINVQDEIKFPVAGSIIKQKDLRTITVKHGWNGIGYTPMLNLPVETALSDYYDKAQPGDVIKSHSEFAYFTVSGGTGSWRGNLEYMKPGEGYMLLRKAQSGTQFTYPFYEPTSTYIDAWATSTTSSATPAKRSTMSVSAVVEGVELEEGDRLLAFADGEVVGCEELKAKGEAAGLPLFYLSIAGNQQQPLWFAIEREGEMIAATDEQMVFKANAVVGSPDEPTAIRFVKADRENGKWYNVSGTQLSKRPTRQGVYIYNGKKVIVK